MPRQPTAFEQRIYAALDAIPPGKAASYAWVAQRARCGSARAVGQALRRNPFAPAVPCHRVVAADRTLGGYQGSAAQDALRLKRERLEAEGVEFDEDGRVALRCFLSASADPSSKARKARR